MGLIASGTETNITDKPGGIFVRPAGRMSTEDRILFESVARAILTDRRGTLNDQIGASRIGEAVPVAPRLTAAGKSRAKPVTEGNPSPPADLLFFNGMGG